MSAQRFTSADQRQTSIDPTDTADTMTLLSSLLISPWILVVLPVLYYVLPYIRNTALAKIPAPFPAQFTNFWLLFQARKGHRYLSVDQAHKKLGKVVRIQPNHISIADDAAIPLIYGHGSEYPSAPVTILQFGP